MTVFLTEQERERFSLWLRQQAESNELMIKQLESSKVGGALVAKKMKVEAMAYQVVAQILDTTTVMTVGTDDVTSE